MHCFLAALDHPAALEWEAGAAPGVAVAAAAEGERGMLHLTTLEQVPMHRQLSGLAQTPAAGGSIFSTSLSALLAYMKELLQMHVACYSCY